MDARDAMKRVLADPRAGSGGRFEGGKIHSHAYTDEPILRTGSELAASKAQFTSENVFVSDKVDSAREDRRRIRMQQRSRWPQTGGARQVARSMGSVWPGDDEAPARDLLSSRHLYDDEAIPCARYAGVANEGRNDRDVQTGTLRVEPPASRTVSWSGFGLDEHLQPEPPLPEPYRLARSFALGPEARKHTGAWVFRRQAEMLATVTDDMPYEGHFEQYLPMYQGMTNAQLRGYVTWRTAVRQGIVQRTSPSFAYVYVFELLMCVGVSSPEEAFERILAFWQVYRELDATLDRHMRIWLRDFVVYYALPVDTARMVPSIETELAFDSALLTLLHPEGKAPEERFDAVSALSSYRIRSSRFAKDCLDDVVDVTLGVVSRLERHYAARRKLGLYESLFGTRLKVPYDMFKAAVFVEDVPHPDVTYVLDDLNSFTCHDGCWTADRILGSRWASSELGSILKATDARMRERFGYAHPLREPNVPKYVQKYIEQAIDERLAWKKTHEPRHIDIDLSRLGSIRSAAALTREKLLVDEERGEDAAGFVTCSEVAAGRPAQPHGGQARATSVSHSGATGSCPAQQSPTELPTGTLSQGSAGDVGQLPADTRRPAALMGHLGSTESAADDLPAGLTAQELAFVRGLLDGSQEVPAGPVGSVDMLVDAINEKLFDLLGDVAVEFGDDGPAIIEEYLDEVRGIVSA